MCTKSHTDGYICIYVYIDFQLMSLETENFSQTVRAALTKWNLSGIEKEISKNTYTKVESF